jgi:hypothetical protein
MNAAELVALLVDEVPDFFEQLKSYVQHDPKLVKSLYPKWIDLPNCPEYVFQELVKDRKNIYFHQYDSIQ